MNTIQDIASARRTVGELCGKDTAGMAVPQLLDTLDQNIRRARQTGDAMAVNILQAVRRSLRDRAGSLH